MDITTADKATITSTSSSSNKWENLGVEKKKPERMLGRRLQ
ncbi:hypothetical protein JCM19239_6404 [Vibrio variabilis]|uniref:Uncharacterized protein n=1 Tax=Vibrio variabilis TaxID=990271 RepID=A0ABQ0JME1_9VIBR|nr:hypothetical protein JCM19239_6404 [Vibrio variabilis]